MILMDSRARLDELNGKLKSAHQDAKLASDEESNAWNNYQAIKLENEPVIEVLRQSTSSYFLKKETSKLEKEIQKLEKLYGASLNSLQKAEEKVEKIRKQIAEINRQRSIAKKAGVSETYLDFVVVRNDHVRNAINIYFNDSPNTFAPKHGHYAIKNNGPYYKREIGEPKGPQNYLSNPNYAAKANRPTSNLLSIA